MRRLWVHRYSVGSTALALANSLLIFGVTGGFLFRASPLPGSGAYHRLVLLDLVAGWTSIGLAAFALAKEHPKGFAVLAMAASVYGFFLCGFRLAG